MISRDLLLAYLNELDSNEKKLSVAAEDGRPGYILQCKLIIQGCIQGGGVGGSSPSLQLIILFITLFSPISRYRSQVGHDQVLLHP